MLFLRKCAIGRSTFLACGQDPVDHLRSRRVQARRRGARMTLTAIAGRVISITSAASSRTSPRRRRSGPSSCAGMIRRSPGPWRSGRSACPAAGPAQRHGGVTPAAWVQAARTPLRRPPPSPRTGVRESGGTPAPRVGSGCPAVRGQPRGSKLLYTPSWASGSGVPQNAYPRRIVRVGRTGSSARDGLAPLRPPLRGQPGQEAWHGRA